MSYILPIGLPEGISMNIFKARSHRHGRKRSPALGQMRGFFGDIASVGQSAGLGDSFLSVDGQGGQSVEVVSLNLSMVPR